MKCSGFYSRLENDAIGTLVSGLPDSYTRDFLADKCITCERVRLLPMPSCPRCGQLGKLAVAIDPHVRLYSWTTTHYPFNASWATVTPYTVATVDNSQGIRLHIPFCADTEITDLVSGAEFKLHREQVDANRWLPIAHPPVTRP